ncbi:MAG: ATPase domain-containing protein [Candidatus Bathyarchaeia archaeon]
MLFEPLPPPSNLLVEYGAASQWYNTSLTMVAEWIKSGGTVSYNALAQSPSSIRSKLLRLGLDVEQLEKLDWEGLRILDGHAAAHGKKSTERLTFDSLKVADLSISTSQEMKSEDYGPAPSHLIVMDDLSSLSRFNDEKALVEYELTRDFPYTVQYQLTNLIGVIGGIHSDYLYKRLEAEVDGVIDFKVEESAGEVVNFIRIRVMRNVGFDSRWHRLKIAENFEVKLEK